MGRCKRVLCVCGREITGKRKCVFLRVDGGRKVERRQVRIFVLEENFMAHGFLHPATFAEASPSNTGL